MGDDTLNYGGVYLLHFERPYRHARHYIGYARNIAARVQLHQDGQGARLLQVIRGAGIAFLVARTWKGASRTDERKLKNRKDAPSLCPICRAAHKARKAA